MADNHYKLWLNYYPIENTIIKNSIVKHFNNIQVLNNDATIDIIKKELNIASAGFINRDVKFNTPNSETGLLIGTLDKLPNNIAQRLDGEFKSHEGFAIFQHNNTIVITALSTVGLLYGTYNLLENIGANYPLTGVKNFSEPLIQHRILNHWDNLNGTVERGYSGASIFNWHTLPDYIDQRYIDYARANASIGINGTVLTNVNSNATILTGTYLQKVKALANVFRPFGIKVYLSARFSAPIELGKLKTADPLNADVQQWWANKINEIYDSIPDFGGFVVKANSEGQPGPQDYNRTHADGANMLAKILLPKKGIVMWRAFVYSHEQNEDRHKQAYNEFTKLDGQFLPNVMVQVKNGAIDFMPREPFHPLFGAMPKTPLMLELQITQEYLGQATTLAYLAPMYKEVLDSDTYAEGKGSTIGKLLHNQKLNGIAGVANIGADINWTGHLFGQSNWFAFGKQSWNYNASPKEIADTWLKLTFKASDNFYQDISKIMLNSREAVVKYSNPLGLHHLMGTGHHYGPEPWANYLPREDWNPTYYHKADSFDIGFNRTKTGSNALSQYKPEVQQQWQNEDSIDLKYLLWFHHVNWNKKLNTGRTLWNELCYQYQSGCDDVKNMITTWQKYKNELDMPTFNHVNMLLNIQYKEAVWWRNSSTLYFQTFSKLPFPQFLEKSDKTLEYYQSLKFPYAPGHH
ncbi:alpha-glucuronidase family glycosyl hydrolase [Polluticaenibacter yanchengensis]|uniref:Xylan alpha-1,2-glucuronidase n=1 Tax=Polluticaenibacter yanchengensis TaxID=3014562 RepID=A0ABT4UKN2_9BACT|nr:alpha-glucuronidase family glycosyl hydrolase [Chitinophagaceae bacterium LY-5]